MTAKLANTPELPTIKPAILAPPKEFFRQFLNLQHNRVLNEDFPHEKLLTIKYKGANPNFVVNAKGSLSFIKEAAPGEKDAYREVPTTSSEVKFLTYFEGKNAEARFNNKGIMRLWTNWGNYNVGKPLEFISVFKADTVFKNIKAYLTAGYHGANVDATGRLQLRYENNKPAFSYAEKVTINQGKFWAGVYGDFDFSTVQLRQYNALLGYNVNKNFHVYAEHITVPPKKGEEFTYRPGQLAVTGIYKDTKYWGLAQVTYDATNESTDFLGGVVYTIDNNTSVRAKISHNADLTFGARYRVNKNLSLNLGTFATLKTPEKIVDTSKTVPIPFGVQLEFTF